MVLVAPMEAWRLIEKPTAPTAVGVVVFVVFSRSLCEISAVSVVDFFPPSAAVWGHTCTCGGCAPRRVLQMCFSCLLICFVFSFSLSRRCPLRCPANDTLAVLSVCWLIFVIVSQLLCLAGGVQSTEATPLLSPVLFLSALNVFYSLCPLPHPPSSYLATVNTAAPLFPLFC